MCGLICFILKKDAVLEIPGYRPVCYYQADLPYDRSAKVVLSRGQKQGDKSFPLLFGLVVNALLLALKATGVGHRGSGPR